MLPCQTDHSLGELRLHLNIAEGLPAPRLDFQSSAGDGPGWRQVLRVMAEVANVKTNHNGTPTVREVGYPAAAAALWTESK